MHRTVVNVQTGEVTQVELTAEEVAQAEAQYAAWLAEQPLPPDDQTGQNTPIQE
jgi:L-alanine-DL-glutamate epimerase-like enolase superfamily enzyme